MTAGAVYAVDMSRRLPFLKGHGTGNDFVLIIDQSNAISLDEADVQWLCDRHLGIGADGVIRIAPADPGMVDGFGAPVAWFMDYRNADGSLAHMCGNGARVFLRALATVGLIGEGEQVAFATRGGVRQGRWMTDGRIAIDMGHAALLPVPAVQVRTEEGAWSAIAVQVPNPHAVVVLPGIEGVGVGPTVGTVGTLDAAPTVTPAFPDGINVEFVQALPDGSVRMRVHERGVGETLACGTGACAVAWALFHQAGTAFDRQVRVHQPGGAVDVQCAADGALTLIGDAVIVAEGTVVLP